ncbi:hypothetical protein CDL15_Pgr028073 [Punica granatum]|uniref:DNA topoisomerase (ATP-hydrolyzing) n=1 Tax=Punica granatum TaxID=22663 RepID=A0A218XKR2_PUNGR|nr:hypothetical protein CDL15_Pgr028073 [Punica granatum]
MEDLCKSSLTFFSDQQLCYADVLPPPEVRARIEIAVLNFLRILNSPEPAISLLPLLSTVKFLVLHVWKVMEMCFQILVEGKRVTQRELFYKLLCTSPNYFSSQLQVNRTIQGKEEIDCGATGSSGHAISGDLSLLGNLVMRADARYIILVEKHAIFQRLVEDRVFNQIPSILITARGYPDIATRNFPELPILALVDWNPAGLAILCTFKFGSIGMGLEAYRYACNVKWLGLRGDDLELIPQESLTPLKPKDLQIAKSLISLEILPESYLQELALMTQSGCRAEIEALYFNGYDYLGKYIATKIVRANYI